MPTLSIWNSTREGAWIMKPGQWGMKWKFTRNLSEPHTRYSKEDSSSFKGKRQSYWVPDSKIIHAQKNVPMINHFVWLITQSVLIRIMWLRVCYLHKQVMLPDYVRRSHQFDLSKTSKHWDIFLSHCKHTSTPNRHTMPKHTSTSRRDATPQHNAASTGKQRPQGTSVAFMNVDSNMSQIKDGNFGSPLSSLLDDKHNELESEDGEVNTKIPKLPGEAGCPYSGWYNLQDKLG